MTPKYGIFIGLPGTNKVPTYFRGEHKYYYGDSGHRITEVSGIFEGFDYFIVMAYAGPELLILWSGE